ATLALHDALTILAADQGAADGDAHARTGASAEGNRLGRTDFRLPAASPVYPLRTRPRAPRDAGHARRVDAQRAAGALSDAAASCVAARAPGDAHPAAGPDPEHRGDRPAGRAGRAGTGAFPDGRRNARIFGGQTPAVRDLARR